MQGFATRQGVSEKILYSCSRDWYLLVLASQLVVVLAETRDARYCLSIACHTLHFYSLAFFYMHFVLVHMLQ